MKWRSVEELPKIAGEYLCLSKTYEVIETENIYYSFDEQKFYLNEWQKILAWFDPEIPEEFLKPKEPEKRPCPWCGGKEWQIAKVKNYLGGLACWFHCSTKNCGTGPTLSTVAEAEAAIFERGK